MRQGLSTSPEEAAAKMKCSFCKKDIERGTGKIFVTKEGKILNFCSRKCEKNRLKLKRNPRNLKWAGGEKK